VHPRPLTRVELDQVRQKARDDLDRRWLFYQHQRPPTEVLVQWGHGWAAAVHGLIDAGALVLTADDPKEHP
jgi:hypothetical protein